MSYNFQNSNMNKNNNFIESNAINVKFNKEQNQMNKHFYKNNMNYYNENKKKKK